jgi:membrane carboxypeptidase/penicillin-binding protein PbpC
VEREICALSGHAANDWCPSKRREWVAAERPLIPCSWHHLSAEGVVTVFPPEYRAWASTFAPQRRVGATADKGVTDLPAAANLRRHGGQLVPLRIASPANGSTFLIDPTLRREFQALSLRAVSAGSGPIEWSVNGEPAGRAEADSKVNWSLRPGRHHIVARDESGRTAEAYIVVR